MSSSFSTLHLIDFEIDSLTEDELAIQQTTSFSKESFCSDVTGPIAVKENYETRSKKLWPPRGCMAKWSSWLMLLATAYGAIWAIFPEKMVPNQSLFGMVLTILLSIIAEQLVVKVPTSEGLPTFPPFLASILMGLALRNIPHINIAAYIDPKTSSIIREMSLTVILTRAGMEKPVALKKVKWAVARLAFIPCLIETILIGISGNYLMGFPLEWSFLMGFIMGAIPTAVVIPPLKILQKAGYGTARGVPSFLMAACGVDDLFAIAGFAIMLGIAVPGGFSADPADYKSDGMRAEEAVAQSPAYPATTGIVINTTDVYNQSIASIKDTTNQNHSEYLAASHSAKEIGGALLQIIIGIVSGVVIGLFLSYLPNRNMRYKNFVRGFLLLSIAILFAFGSAVWEIPGSGAICALVLAFTASAQWKEETKPLLKAWDHMWIIFQPILFGLTGALIDVTAIDGKRLGLGIAVVVIGLAARILASTAVTFGLNFNLKERLFISTAWVPKGTLQTALAAVVLDEANYWQRPDQELEWGMEILVLAILITIITSSIGGFVVAKSGTRLLDVSSSTVQDNEACLRSQSEKDYKCPGRQISLDDNVFAETELTIVRKKEDL